MVPLAGVTVSHVAEPVLMLKVVPIVDDMLTGWPGGCGPPME